MRLDSVRVELRPRSAWEAVDLGMALVRVHAGAIWRPWLLLTLPLFALVNAAAWLMDLLWLAPLLMWWLLPVFDRIPLFVLSRAVFGDAPSTRQTLAAQRHWGWRSLGGYLTWRRLSPWRATTLPVDLLEGNAAASLRGRRRVIGDGIQGHAMLLTATCHMFIAALTLSLASLVFMFIPTELLPESARAVWILVSEHPPKWLLLVWNAMLWAAMSVIEPFFVGAGFALYLNRRVQIEAWDIEIALRRMLARIGQGAATLLVAIAMVFAIAMLAAPDARAQAQGAQPVDHSGDEKEGEGKQGSEAARSTTPTLPAVFGNEGMVDDKPFRKAVAEAYEDPLLDRSLKQVSWERRDKKKPSEKAPPDLGPFMKSIAAMAALIGEYGLWLVFVALVLLLVLTAKHWWPWMQGVARLPERESELQQVPAAEIATLPEDLVGEVRRLWREGRPRRALALLYRGSVEAMAERIGVALVPGATEAECLRASRRLPDEGDRSAFARMVRVWQYAAYGAQLPDEATFDALVGDLAQRFGWSR